MKKQILIFINLLFVLLFYNTVYADTKTITCNENINGDTVYIYGQIPDSVQKNMVSLIVCEDVDNITEDNIVYIDQTTSSTSGNFEFSFSFPSDSGVTSYEYIIGTDAGTDTYSNHGRWRTQTAGSRRFDCHGEPLNGKVRTASPQSVQSGSRRYRR